ncbi:uncharacterized protein LOC129798366 [Phlebotomus papatasi]|uniref:uncharacterized protein LOC129798366 n=1 Tax=Phlebotomus papatasi TaxID=29031 RepID=UPI0024838DA6|nr:uncharacterized protein LOC129798366 [Phlebotomus papatasi]
MAYFMAQRGKVRKYSEDRAFLQPTKRPGYSVSLPGSFKNSLYWKTLDNIEGKDEKGREEQIEQVTNPQMHIPTSVSPENPNRECQAEDDTPRKSLQYRELVSDCGKKSVSLFENLDKLLAECEEASVIEISMNSTGIQETITTDVSDTSWLNNLLEEDSNMTDLDLSTQILNEITGRKTTKQTSKLTSFQNPEGEVTEEVLDCSGISWRSAMEDFSWGNTRENISQEFLF